MKKSVKSIVDLVLQMAAMVNVSKEEIIEALQATKVEAKSESSPQPFGSMMLETIDTLDLQPRTYNSLRGEKIKTMANLLSRSLEEISKIPRLGPAAMQDLTTCLANKGLKLSVYSFETMPTERPQAFKVLEANTCSNYLRNAGYYPNDLIYLTSERMDEILKANGVKPAMRKKFFNWVNYSV